MKRPIMNRAAMKQVPSSVSISRSLEAKDAEPETDSATVARAGDCDPSLISGISLMNGFTVPLGDFKFFKVEVTVHVPCENRPKARRDAVEQASAELNHYMQQEVSLCKQRYEAIVDV
ncbi:MAG: hypothetical protein ABW007_19505 [Chitinophagaceae bacterium]